MNPLFLSFHEDSFIWNGVASAILANPSVFVAQVMPHWHPQSTSGQHTEQWTDTQYRDLLNPYLYKRPVEFLDQSLRWVSICVTFFEYEGFEHDSELDFLHGHFNFFLFWCTCLGFHSCLVHLNICQQVAIVDWEFDLEPLICKNLTAIKESFVNSKEWDFCVLASDCSSCFSWHQWVNNSWAAAAGRSSSISLERSSSSSWPAAAGRWWWKGSFQRKEAAQPQRKSLALTTFQTSFRRDHTKPANTKGHSNLIWSKS